MLPFQTALVTGATGFIGQHLVRHLVAENVTTHCLVRAKSLTPEKRQVLSGAHCRTLNSDSPEDWKRALGGLTAEAVFHLASAGVVGNREPPEALVGTNVRLLCRLLGEVRNWPLRCIIHTGSFSEYAPSDDILTENSPLLPTTAYGASKAAAWLGGRALAAQLGLPLINLRLFQVYGPGEANGRLIPYLHERLSRGQLAQLTAGQQVRDLVFIDDVIEALLAAASLPLMAEPMAYNICSGEGITVRQIGELTADQMHAPRSLLRWGELPYRPGEMMRAVGNNRPFAEASGWQPRIGLEEGIARSLASLGWQSPFRVAG